MIAGIAADGVLIVHLMFVLFAIFGGLLVWHRPSAVCLHLPALVWGVWIEATHGICPLTGYENALLQAAGRRGYQGGFIEHYLVPLIYPPGLQPETQWRLAIAFAIWSLGIYVLVWRRHRATAAVRGHHGQRRETD